MIHLAKPATRQPSNGGGHRVPYNSHFTIHNCSALATCLAMVAFTLGAVAVALLRLLNLPPVAGFEQVAIGGLIFAALMFCLPALVNLARSIARVIASLGGYSIEKKVRYATLPKPFKQLEILEVGLLTLTVATLAVINDSQSDITLTAAAIGFGAIAAVNIVKVRCWFPPQVGSVTTA